MEIDFKWLLTVLGAIAGFLAKHAWDSLSKTREERERDLMQTMATLTVAVTELKIQVATLTERLAPMPKIQQDLNELHGKVRELATRTAK